MRVNVNNLTFAYTQKLVLNDISFSLKSGEFLTIHGKNGTGKTTLIKCFLKLLKISDGMIYLDDIDINKMRRFRNIGMFLKRTNSTTNSQSLSVKSYHVPISRKETPFILK